METTVYAAHRITHRLKIAREEVTKVMTIGYSQSSGKVIKQSAEIIAGIDKLTREINR